METVVKDDVTYTEHAEEDSYCYGRGLCPEETEQTSMDSAYTKYYCINFKYSILLF